MQPCRGPNVTWEEVLSSSGQCLGQTAKWGSSQTHSRWLVSEQDQAPPPLAGLGEAWQCLGCPHVTPEPGRREAKGGAGGCSAEEEQAGEQNWSWGFPGPTPLPHPGFLKPQSSRSLGAGLTWIGRKCLSSDPSRASLPGDDRGRGTHGRSGGL